MNPMVSWRSAANWLSVEQRCPCPRSDRPLGGPVEPADDVQQRGLAAAAGPHQTDEFAWHDGEVRGDESLDDLVAELVELPNVGDLDDRRTAVLAGRSVTVGVVDGGHVSLPLSGIGWVAAMRHSRWG